MSLMGLGRVTQPGSKGEELSLSTCGPVCSRKQTSAYRLAMSQKCHEQTHAPQQVSDIVSIVAGSGGPSNEHGLYLTPSSLQEDVAIAFVVLRIDHVQPASLPRLEEHLNTAIPEDIWGSVFPRGTARIVRWTQCRHDLIARDADAYP